MDAQRLETLANAGAGVGSRRRALGGLLAGALALAGQAVTARAATRTPQSSFPPIEPGMYEEPYRAPGQYASLVPPPPAAPTPAPSVWARVKARVHQAREDVREAIPDVDLPDLHVPDLDVPDVSVPDVEVPDVAVPDVDMPNVSLPDVGMPDVEVRHPFADETAPVDVLATCSDGVRNGSESDVDCGGPICRRCATGQTCAGQADCSTALCINTVCRACRTDDVCGSDSNGACQCRAGVCLTSTSTARAAVCADCPPSWTCVEASTGVACFAPCGSS